MTRSAMFVSGLSNSMRGLFNFRQVDPLAGACAIFAASILFVGAVVGNRADSGIVGVMGVFACFSNDRSLASFYILGLIVTGLADIIRLANIDDDFDIGVLTTLLLLKIFATPLTATLRRRLYDSRLSLSSNPNAYAANGSPQASADPHSVVVGGAAPSAPAGSVAAGSVAAGSYGSADLLPPKPPLPSTYQSVY